MRTIEYLRGQLSLVRGVRVELERRGYSGRQIAELQNEAWKLSGMIEMREKEM
jgi:hypothetical protein